MRSTFLALPSPMARTTMQSASKMIVRIAIWKAAQLWQLLMILTRFAASIYTKAVLVAQLITTQSTTRSTFLALPSPMASSTTQNASRKKSLQPANQVAIWKAAQLWQLLMILTRFAASIYMKAVLVAQLMMTQSTMRSMFLALPNPMASSTMQSASKIIVLIAIWKEAQLWQLLMILTRFAASIYTKAVLLAQLMMTRSTMRSTFLALPSPMASST